MSDQPWVPSNELAAAVAPDARPEFEALLLELLGPSLGEAQVPDASDPGMVGRFSALLIAHGLVVEHGQLRLG